MANLLLHFTKQYWRDQDQPKWLGGACPDGGVCHHGCRTRCWRVSNAAPLDDSGLDENWKPINAK